ncbi:MAG: hypothetical protein AAB294_04850, partial [Pseudomonadota bacterium]
MKSISFEKYASRFTLHERRARQPMLKKILFFFYFTAVITTSAIAQPICPLDSSIRPRGAVSLDKFAA